MATLTIPDATYAKLANRASRVGVTVDEFVLPLIEGEPETEVNTPSDSLQREQAFHRLTALVRSFANHFPPDHRLDVSRESIYA